MDGLMMDYQLTVPSIMLRAETFYGNREIITRLPDKSYHRYTYGEFATRAKKLAVGLQKLGIKKGDRVGTFSWSHYQHLEAYFGIPFFGGVLHTLNLRLGADDLTYIINHGGDRAIIIDHTLLPLYEKFRNEINVEFIIVIQQGDQPVPDGMINYEDLLQSAGSDQIEYLDINELEAAAMCYTSGTTGKPKGVLYNHRAIVLHSLGSALSGTLDLKESDTVLPVVPMFHVNAWGLPFTCTMLGAKQVFPGPHLDPVSLLETFEAEKVTVTAGVPTIWFGMLQVLDQDPGKYSLESLRSLIVGGSAVPKAMIQGFEERHSLKVVQAWGMTETTPLGTVANLSMEMQKEPKEKQYNYRAKQGTPIPFVEIRGRSENALIPWDGKTMGELEVRGPWVASSYYDSPEITDRFTDDGWFCTGDIVTIDPTGCIEIQDRSKDVIKSGGEWISSVLLENTLMSHPNVSEAAVISVSHPKWQERPLAVVVLKDGFSASKEELLAHLEPHFEKWWLPDAFEFVDEIPKTAVGKFKKTALRDQFKDYKLQTEE